ncbi:hypothetical protein NPIL_218941 [Nephila pilipes]|uniref:Uncharacterized protein n=1 Tax=Nephila pilipes TaxID=299642 RepID=A0A8X6U9Q8_NEPPI|nr:hypothetical protein NPIL_218941 [Nephila pilipes]
MIRSSQPQTLWKMFLDVWRKTEREGERYLNTNNRHKSEETSVEGLDSHTKFQKTDKERGANKVRRYNENYLSMAFTPITDSECPSRCVSFDSNGSNKIEQTLHNKSY